MRIGIDYDNTITEDFEFWSEFVQLTKKYKHQVTIVTYRGYSVLGNSDIQKFAFDNQIEVVYTSGKQKEHLFKADVWIDDSPITIPKYIDLVDMANGCKINDDMKEAFK